MQAKESLGAGIASAAGSVADAMKNQKQQEQNKKMMDLFGIGKQTGLIDTQEPTNDQLAQGLQDYGKKAGVNVEVNHGDNPDQARSNMMGIYKALGVPVPQGTIKVNADTNMKSGMKATLEFDDKGNLRPKFTTVDPETQELKEQNMQIKKQMDQESEDKFKDKRITDLGSELDPSKFRQGVFGQEAQTFDRGEALQSLMNQADTQPGGADTRQIAEAAIGLQNMLSRGNSSVTEVMQLVPQSMQGNADKITEWLINNPTGLQQQAFTDRLKGTIQRELDTSNDQMNRVKYRRLAKYEDVKDKYPDDWDRVLRANGVNPDDYEQWKKDGYKKISAIQGGSSNSATATLKAAGMGGQSQQSSGNVDYKSKYGLN
jgi:hypothetical protein